MKELTAVFMGVLGEKTGQAERVATLVRENMRKEILTQAGDLVSASTMFFSTKGRKLQQEVEMLKKKVEGMTRADQAAGLSSRLRDIFIRAEKLHRETQKEIHKPGHIRMENIHLFYAREQKEALVILDGYIKAELFRIIAAGGIRFFSRPKPLNGFAYNLRDRVKYLQQEILPVTDSQAFKEAAGLRYWAVVQRSQMKAGPMGVLPGFEIVEPVKVDHPFMPGESKVLPFRKDVVIQGMGQFTNVVPENVDMVQRRGALHSELQISQLLPYVEYLNEPHAVLREIFGGAPYVISPDTYFAAASYVLAADALIRRRIMHQCQFCGQSTDGGSFCERCRKRIRIG